MKHVDQPTAPADNQLETKYTINWNTLYSPHFTFNFSFMFEISLIFLYSLMSVAWMADFDFEIQFKSSALSASNLV